MGCQEVGGWERSRSRTLSKVHSAKTNPSHRGLNSVTFAADANHNCTCVVAPPTACSMFPRDSLSGGLVRGTGFERGKLGHALLDFGAEVADEPLHGPGRGIAKSADGVARSGVRVRKACRSRRAWRCLRRSGA